MRGSRIFGGFLRFFGSIPESGFLGARIAKHGLLFADHGQPVTIARPLPTGFARRLPVAGLRGADHGQPVTVHGARCTVRGLVGLGQRARGAARLH